MFSHIISVLYLLVFVTGVRSLLRLVLCRPRAPYPPGPRPKPLIGNILDFPLFNAIEEYVKMGIKFNSTILHLEALGSHVIVLNSLKDADELLEKRARIYSDRPHIPILKMMGWDVNVSLLHHNDDWRFHRKICQQNFRQDASHEYLPIQEKKVHELLQGLLETPHELDAHNKRLSVAIPLATMYGYEAKSLEDPCVVAADESAVIGASLLLPGANFINILPILGRIPAWVPGAKSVRMAAEADRLTAEVKRIPMEYTKRRMAEGTATPSLVSNFLEKKFRTGATEQEERAIENIAYTVYGAASDTTISATGTFFYLMAKHPEVQKRAQAEIDEIIQSNGTLRLPNYGDRQSGRLPFIEAIYREVMRMGPSIPLCIPHAAEQDDYYNGYLIPKGATILANIWAMTHDESKYPEPFDFKPERFLDEYNQLNDDDRILAYGFGRRVCVGKYVASSTLWLVMVSVIACFDIIKATDIEGNTIEINDDYEEFGLVRHKAKFECAFKVRSPELEKLITGTNFQ